MDKQRDRFRISTDPQAMDVSAIHAYLTRSYWAEGISEALVRKSLSGSLCFSLRDGDRQIGFARVITDRTTYAYLCDVYVLEEYQGRKLGTWLIETVLAHPDLQNLRRFSLVTRDAHGLYAPFGFETVHHPDRHMEIVRPGLYKTPPQQPSE